MTSPFDHAYTVPPTLPTPPIATTGVHRRRADRRPEHVVRDGAERHPQHRADKQRGGEHPSRPADRQGQARGQDLADHQHDDEPQRVLTGDRLAQHRVADPVHLRKRQQQHPQRDPTDRGARPLRAGRPQLIDDVLEPVQKRLKPRPTRPAANASTATSRKTLSFATTRSWGTWVKNGAEPKNARLITSPVTAARLVANSASSENSRSTISNPKNRPVIGALRTSRRSRPQHHTPR